MVLFGLVVGALMTVVVYGAYILIISFTLWMAVDAAKQDRFWWVTLIIGIPVIGCAAYFFTEKKHIYAQAKSHHIHTSETEIEHEISPKKHEKIDMHRKEENKEGESVADELASKTEVPAEEEEREEKTV